MTNQDTLTFISYNIHKGMSPLNRTPILSQLSSALDCIPFDVLCLQEVQGQNDHKHALQPYYPQHSWLERHLSIHAVYAQNATYAHGHHGNAVLARHALTLRQNVDLTVQRFEQRGLLHVEMNVAGRRIAILNTHLNLLQRHRALQYRLLVQYIRRNIDINTPLVVLGDFNDWAHQSARFLHAVQLREVFMQLGTKPPRTFPARLPILSLDRIFVRGVAVVSAQVYDGQPWSFLSDHLPIGVTIRLAE